MTSTTESRPAASTTRFDLTGRVAVITGGTRGIGLAIAHGLVASGAKVVVSSRKADATDAAVSALAARGGEAIGVAGNMADLSLGPTLVEAAVNNFGRLDIVINNAANALTLPLGEITPEAWDKVYAVDARGPLFLVQAALPQLRTSPSAAVVNVVSPGAFTFAGGTALYSSAKAALVSLTRSMAEAFAPDGIRVNALSPGPTNTEMVQNTSPEHQRRLAGRTLLKRLAEPAEMAEPALFLASDASSYMTGQVLAIDGGMLVH